MGVDEITVDLLSLDDFNRRLTPRLVEANAALALLTNGPAQTPPALGAFEDAQLTASRHQALYDDYVTQLRRLIDALTVAQAATTAIAARYRTVEELNGSTGDDVDRG